MDEFSFWWTWIEAHIELGNGFKLKTNWFGMAKSVQKLNGFYLDISGQLENDFLIDMMPNLTHKNMQISEKLI